MTVKTADYTTRVRYLIFDENTTISELMEVALSTNENRLGKILDRLYVKDVPMYGKYVINADNTMIVVYKSDAVNLLRLEN